MAAINQRIPNFLGGVSQQPDFIKFPGQLRTCHNAFPDVTFGLQKRPPGEFVGKLTNAKDGGEWFDIIRDGKEKYLIQVANTVPTTLSNLSWTRANAGNDTTVFTSNNHSLKIGDEIQATIGATDIGTITAVSTNTFTAKVGNIQNGTSGTSTVVTQPTLRAWALVDIAAGTGNYTSDVAAGTELTIKHKTSPTADATSASENFQYLAKSATAQPYGKITINDLTLIANPDKEVAVDAVRKTPVFNTNYAFITLKEIAYNAEYVVALGATNLTPSTKRRVESLEVVKAIGSGGSSIATWEWHTGDNTGTQGSGGDDFIGIDPGTAANTGSATWQTSSPRSVYTGKKEYTGTTAGDAWEDVKFTVSVNATHFVNHYNSNNPNYDTQYTATVVLQESGLDVGTNWASLYKVVNVNGQNWLVTIKSVSEYESYIDSNAAVYRTPRNIKKGEVTKDIVLGNLAKKIVDKYNTGGSTVACHVTGSGIFIDANYAFNTVGVKGGMTGDALEAITNTAQNISKLPGQCKDGYIVKVSNTEDSQSDDYYVKFVTSGNASGDLGAGVWEETVAPNIDAGFDYTTMPHGLINHRNGTFTWTALAYADTNNDGINDYTCVEEKSADWKDRDVGDDLTNPMPTFVGQKISSLFFVRNRLGLISGEQVVMSQPADYFNFFVGSAIAASDADPIDMGASDVRPAIINYAIPIQKGVMLFSEAAQFMLFTESEEFSPKTAQLKKLSAYENTTMFSPVDTGTAVMFASTTGSYSKVFELILGASDVPPKVVEQTRVVPEYVPKNVDILRNSAEMGLVTLGTKGSSTLYHYKYFDGGQQREQSSWFSWDLEGTLVHLLYTDGDLVTLTKQGSEYILQRFEFVVDSTDTRSYTIGSGTVGSPTSISRRFECCLDNMYMPSASEKNAALGLGASLVANYTPVERLSAAAYDKEWFRFPYATNNLIISPPNIEDYVVGDQYQLTWSGTSNNSNTSLNGSYQVTGILYNKWVVFGVLFGSLKDYDDQVAAGHAGSTAGTLTVTHPSVATLFGLEVTLPYKVTDGVAVLGTDTNLRLVDLSDGLTLIPRYCIDNKAYFDVDEKASDGTTIDYDAINYAIGYTYTTEIGLPTYYLSKERGQYDVDADLRIHRLNFDLGVSGPMDFHITSPQRDTYVHEETGIILDEDSLDTIPSELYKNISIPIYKKNTKYDCTVKIPAPFTATLVSASWDGNYNTRRHVRQ